MAQKNLEKHREKKCFHFFYPKKWLKLKNANQKSHFVDQNANQINGLTKNYPRNISTHKNTSFPHKHTLERIHEHWKEHLFPQHWKKQIILTKHANKLQRLIFCPLMTQTSQMELEEMEMRICKTRIHYWLQQSTLQLIQQYQTENIWPENSTSWWKMHYNFSG